MMKRLLSRKTKPVTLDRSFHLSPVLVGNRPGDLAADALEIAPARRHGGPPQTRSSRFDLASQAAIDRIRRGTGGLDRGLDDGHRSPAFGDREALSCLDPPQNLGGVVLELAHADLGFRVHVATNVATNFSSRQAAQP